jgi:hypothetical protein
MAVPIDTVAVDRLQLFQRFFLQRPHCSGMGYGLSIAGHVIIGLLLLFGLLERIDIAPVAAIPVEIVMEKPAEAARQNAPASPPAVSALNEQSRPSGIPAVADVDKRAKAPLAALNVNGIDRPKQPGHDGSDPSPQKAGLPLPAADSGVTAGGLPSPSRAVIDAPIGPALPQTTAREPGEDEFTALKEQNVLCGIRARRPLPTAPARAQARVTGFETEAQAIESVRSTQTARDRRMNPNYLRKNSVFAETVDGEKKSVTLPPGFTVNVGDVIVFDRGYIDPSNSCQFIPNLAVSKP